MDSEFRQTDDEGFSPNAMRRTASFAGLTSRTKKRSIFPSKKKLTLLPMSSDHFNDFNTLSPFPYSVFSNHKIRVVFVTPFLIQCLVKGPQILAHLPWQSKSLASSMTIFTRSKSTTSFLPYFLSLSLYFSLVNSSFFIFLRYTILSIRFPRCLFKIPTSLLFRAYSNFFFFLNQESPCE